MGVPAVTGAGLEIDLDAGEVRVNGTTLKAGDRIAIDGTSGSITTDDVPLVEPQVGEHFDTILKWSDELRTLEVRANADTPDDAKRSREFGATGIGLCRTEHMFFGDDRHEKMVAVILGSTTDERRERLEELLPFQQDDFEGLFEAMEGLPVTIRLLDPPLHEFLPNAAELAVEIERARSERPHDVRRLERTLARVRELEETNPMLGTRGARLGIIAPEIYDVQVEAIVAAARAVKQRHGEAPEVEIMIPLVAYEQEVQILRERVERVITGQGADDMRPLIGTMIELPRACFVADRIARAADFFSFGTNDLTQTALGFSRDDVESGFLSEYLEHRIVDRSPFETIDEPGVGWLVRLAAWVGREARHDLKLGICGEHGGDPDSIAFFHRAGLDYVSCSPYRVPIARVAAAQAAARESA
jgi:pyruvate,orthophosphate dikinase